MSKDAKQRDLQKRANKLANEMMREDGLDPVRDQKLRAQYYMRARERLLLGRWNDKITRECVSDELVKAAAATDTLCDADGESRYIRTEVHPRTAARRR